MVVFPDHKALEATNIIYSIGQYAAAVVSGKPGSCPRMNGGKKRVAGGIRGDFTGKRILVAGNPNHEYLSMIASGFKACGLETAIHKWEWPKPNPIKELGMLTSDKYRKNIYELWGKTYSMALERAVSRLVPDYVLLFKGGEGAYLTEATRAFSSRSGMKLVMWACDSVQHYPQIADVAAGCDLTYSFEPTDIQELSKLCRAKYLPLAYDPSKYHPINSSRCCYVDVAFVGTLHSPGRSGLLRYIARELPDLEVGVWSDSRNWYSPLKLNDILFASFRGNLHLKRKTLEHAMVNQIYNNSRICLNITHPQSREGVNPRTFEVLGSQGLLVTDKKLDSLEDFICGRDYVFYGSRSELIGELSRFVRDDEGRFRIRRSGHSIAEKRHTYTHRALTIMNDLCRM